MTGTEKFGKMWRLVAKEKDYSLVDEIYHPDYKAISHMTGVEVNLEADKEAHLALIEHLIVAPAKIVNESEDFLCIQRYSKYREADIFMSGATTITCKDGKIISQDSIPEKLDYDPSEGQDWNWEDYE